MSLGNCRSYSVKGPFRKIYNIENYREREQNPYSPNI
nr:MAG TPA: hypothetical protein [Caudoviricetes sp.]